MPGRSYIVCAMVFALVLARANAFSQGAAALADARFDSLGRVAMANFVEGKFFWKSHFDLLVPREDSSLFVQFALQRKDKHVFYGNDPKIVPKLADDTERQVHIFTSIRRLLTYEQGGKDTVFARGSIAVSGYTPGYVSVPFVSTFEVFRDTILPSARINTIATDTPQHSVWDSTLKPVLVTVGAAAIVALFFLIRS
jgi:hypothetical protein